MQVSDSEENQTESTNDRSSPESMDRRPSRSSRSSSNQGFGPILRNSRFLTLWGGQVFSQLADKIYQVLMVAVLESHFTAPGESISGSLLSAIYIANTIPAVLFGSLAGVYVDRWLKKGVLVFSNLIRGGLVLALPVLLWLFQSKQGWMGLSFEFWVLLSVTFLVSTLTQFFAPAEQATLALVVKNRHLLAANSINTTTMMTMLIVGTALGEPLLVWADRLVGGSVGTWDFGQFLVVGGAYVISGVVLILLNTRERADRIDKDSPHVFEDILDGLRYLRINHHVRNAMIQLVILYSVFAALFVLAIRMAETIPGLRASQYGFLLAAAGVGLASVAAIITYRGQRFSHAQLSLWGSMGMAASLVGLGLATKSLWLALAMTGCFGAFAALVGVPMQTTLLGETPIEMRGKVFGLENNAINIAISLPLVLATKAEEYFGLRSVLLSLAILCVVAGILSWYVARLETEKSYKVDK
jgi:predicted MFS family arabinose efflux permease